jgi:hypothetical protein
MLTREVQPSGCMNRGVCGLRVAVGVTVGCLAGLAVVVSVPVATAAPPNPCQLAPASALDRAFGVSAAVSLVGKPSSQKKGGTGVNPPVYTLTVCTFVHGGDQAQIKLGPKGIGLGSGGGAPGMVTQNEATLGQGASYQYDVNAKFAFAEVTFIKGTYWVQVYADNGKIAPSKVLALGRTVYSRLP